MRGGFLRLQALLRAFFIQRHYHSVRAHIVTVQRLARGVLARRCAKRRVSSVVVIQKFMRGHLARKHFVQVRVEHDLYLEATRLRALEEDKLK